MKQQEVVLRPPSYQISANTGDCASSGHVLLYQGVATDLA